MREIGSWVAYAAPISNICARKGNWLGGIAVTDAMDRAFTRCDMDMPMSEARALMAAAGVKQLPAVDRQGRFLGVVEVLDINHAA